MTFDPALIAPLFDYYGYTYGGGKDKKPVTEDMIWATLANLRELVMDEGTEWASTGRFHVQRIEGEIFYFLEIGREYLSGTPTAAQLRAENLDELAEVAA